MATISNRLRLTLAVAALVLATGLVVIAMLSVAFDLDQLKGSFGWVKHTDDVLLQIAGVESDFIAAESAERGYLLTGNPQYQTNFEDDRNAIRNRFERLTKLVNDNQAQLRRLADLRQSADARLQEFKQIIAIGPQRLEAAVAAVRAAAPQRLTEVVRTKLRDLRQEEVRLRTQREARAARDMTRTIIFVIGSTLLALLSGAVGLVILQRERDRFQERELELELAHMARLNMMGETAAMLAHELNQPLTAANNYLSAIEAMIAAANAPDAARITQLLGRATAQLQRADGIIRRLRSFIQKSEPTKTTEFVSTVFEDAVGLLGMRRDGLNITTRTAPRLPKVVIDRVEIQQVLVNLMRNAVEAMERQTRRELELSAVSTDDGHVQISVKDSGSGLAQDVADKLFQPFVSTKANGMGVGLSICRTIIVRNGGRIWAESNPQGGTLFSFTIPIASTG